MYRRSSVSAEISKGDRTYEVDPLRLRNASDPRSGDCFADHDGVRRYGHRRTIQLR
jgi:hypothetical protein